MDSGNDRRLVNADNLRNFCARLFQSVGVPQDEAVVNADNLVDADLKGVESHGVTRAPIYLKRLRMGLVRPAVSLEVISEMPSAALVDVKNSMGAAASEKVMRMAIAKAKQTGISFITVRNSNHFSAAAYFAQMALSEDMIGLAGSNGPARMAPWGGSKPMFGTDPFAVAIPAGKRLPVIADMASCVVARGKIIIAAKNGKPIPLGWARDKDGNDTTDAKAALEGTVVPFGGPKGYAIATIIEALTGVLAGSRFGTAINDIYSDFEHPTYPSHYLGAIKVAAFGPVEQFKSQMDEFIDGIKSSTRAKGVEEIFLPGEIELRRKEQRLREGIPLSGSTLGDLKTASEACGVPFDI